MEKISLKHSFGSFKLLLHDLLSFLHFFIHLFYFSVFVLFFHKNVVIGVKYYQNQHHT